ncbi:SnoaL polyketide cyclase [Saccharothrix sp. ALI-22-I]|uniref:ester cyclase n=1 Tax=Saccharothrix sp. ALI-22-I TaxID=1933778 RepID=UPI00097C079D|nr:ester cyclase [Saccharothrix sp. ALI-22-I]ONI90733.1 SnoaL polyketide cyclase [Saccharothrix sp. ALI-22-I]
MDLIETAARWAAAWRERDAAAVAAAVAEFADPDTPEPVGGADLVAHVEAVLTRFPDLALDFAPPADAGDTAVLTWTLAATHRAPYLGMPGTGGAAAVVGADVLTVVDGAVRVRRHFDRVALAASLGHTSRFLPAREDMQEYGVSARTATGRPDYPRVLTFTYLDFRDDVEGPEVDLLSTEVVKSLRASQGFLGVGTFEIGARKYTLTAFDRPESVRAVHARPHQRAMRKFFRSGLCTGAYTSVWTLERESFFLRCPDCQEVVDAGAGKTCACGTTPTPDPLF